MGTQPERASKEATWRNTALAVLFGRNKIGGIMCKDPPTGAIVTVENFIPWQTPGNHQLLPTPTNLSSV
jgi:hypothetical protein